MKTTPQQRGRRDRGSMLVVSIVAIFVLTGIAMAYFSTSLSQSRKAFQDALLARAMYVATCGINAAIVDLNAKCSGNLEGNAYYPDTIVNRNTGSQLFTNAVNDPFYLPGTRPLDVPVRNTYDLQANLAKPIGLRPSGDFTTTSTLNANGTYTVVSTGVFDRKTVTVEAVLKKNPTSIFTFAAFGKDSVVGNGSIFTDSYDSRKGSYASQAVNTINILGNNETYAGVHGDLGSNGTVVTHGAANAIFGNVSPGPGQVFVPTGYVYGSTSPLPTARNLPSYVYSRPASAVAKGNINGGTLTTGTYWATGLDGKVTIDGDVKIYLEGDSSMTGQEVINITATGSLELYIKPGVSVKFAGKGVLNASTIPEKLKIFSASTQDLDLTGNSVFYGVAYAPDSDIKISGNAQNYGALVGRVITLCGGGTRGGFHYDEALAEMMGTVTKYSIQSMRQSLTQSY